MAASFSARVVLLAVTVVAAVAVLWAGGRPAGSATGLRATAAGALALQSSHDGTAVLTVRDLRPGRSATGVLTLTNPARQAQGLRLATTSIADRPGPAGGVLSRRLELRVERAGGREVFAGSLADLEDVALPDLAPTATAVYRMTVTLPQGGPAVDDAFAGSEVDVTWAWTADLREDDAPRAPEPPRADPPAPAAPAPAAPAPRAPVKHSEDASTPADPEGPAPRAARPVGLWIGDGTRGRRPAGSLPLLARCRPTCTLTASAKVRFGRKVRLLPARSLGGPVGAGAPKRVAFRLTKAETRWLRAALRRGPLAMTIVVSAEAPEYLPARLTRTLQLRR